MTRNQHIFVVDDEAPAREMVGDYLKLHGFDVTLCDGGKSLREGIAKQSPDLIVLDLNMPEEDGLSIVRALKQHGTVPIIMLTATASPIDRVVGLELGADDYLVKPFSVRELMARIAAILRRAHGSAKEAGVYDDGSLRIDGRTMRVFVDDEEVRLARKEMELLWMLVRNHPAVVSRDRILAEVWQMADDVETRTVDAHIRNLRKKIGKDRIHTVIGYGYRFEAPGEAGGTK